MTSILDSFRTRRARVLCAILLLLGAPSRAAGGRNDAVPLDSGAAPVVEAEGRIPDALSLRDALALALERSPDLAAFSWEIRAREARALQAGLLPNPVLHLEVENIGGAGDLDGLGSAESTLVLSQLIELGGKPRKRRMVATSKARVAEWEYEASRLRVVTETTAAFVNTLARQEVLRLAGEQIRLAEDVLRSVRAQVRAGAVSAAEVHRAEVEVIHQRIERRRRERALRAAAVRLATAWGDSEPGFEVLVGTLHELSPIPDEGELVDRMAGNPELAGWREKATRRQAAVALEDARRIPDVTIGVGPRHLNATDDWVLVAGLEVPLPLFDRNQGARRESRDRLAKTRAEGRGTELRLRRAVARTYEVLASAHDEASALRDEALPTATRAYEAVRRAQQQGALGLTEVLDSQRSLFAVRTQLVEALASYHTARARAEALIGGPIEAEEPEEKP